MRKQNPLTRFYEIKPGRSGWARIWITDDGCITIMSDWGNYGYWFGDPAMEFRAFLLGCDNDYLGRKFSAGETELDADATARGIKERILHSRRYGSWSKALARVEWQLVKSTYFDDEHARQWWYEHTELSDASDALCYRTPRKVQFFLKNVWPLFVGQLRAELAGEPAVAGSLQA